MPDLLLYINSLAWRFVHLFSADLTPGPGGRKGATIAWTAKKSQPMELVRRAPYAAPAGQGGRTMFETLMPKVRLGRTDLMVSPICFGASGLGDMPATFGYSVSVERAGARRREELAKATTRPTGEQAARASAKAIGEGRAPLPDPHRVLSRTEPRRSWDR